MELRFFYLGIYFLFRYLYVCLRKHNPLHWQTPPDLSLENQFSASTFARVGPIYPRIVH